MDVAGAVIEPEFRKLVVPGVRLAGAIERHFPDLRPVRPLSILGRGFRSVAVETPGGVVLRVGHSPDAASDYAKEWQIVRFLAGHLPEHTRRTVERLCGWAAGEVVSVVREARAALPGRRGRAIALRNLAAKRPPNSL